MINFVLPGNFTGTLNYAINEIDLFSHIPGIQMVSNVRDPDIQL